MKTIITSVLMAVITMLVISCSQPVRTGNAPPIVGTWEYTGNVAGMAIFNEIDFIFLATFKPDSAFSDSLTMDEIVDRYNTMNVVAGTHSIGDSIVTCTTKYHKDPNRVGESWKWSYSLKEDDLHWKAMDANGNVLGEGDAKRVRN